MLDWSQQNLADHAQLSVVTIHQFERGATQPHRATMDVIVRTFEAAGIEFTEDDAPGVKLHKRATVAKKKSKPK
jgi:ribosome-binding protein aMBF1 (putative translation factor)